MLMDVLNILRLFFKRFDRIEIIFLLCEAVSDATRLELSCYTEAFGLAKLADTRTETLPERTMIFNSNVHSTQSLLF